MGSQRKGTSEETSKVLGFRNAKVEGKSVGFSTTLCILSGQFNYASKSCIVFYILILVMLFLF